MALLAAVLVALLATAFAKPQVGWFNPVTHNGDLVSPYHYERLLTYLYPRTTHQTYIQSNPFLVPYTYPVNYAYSNLLQYPKFQPYWFLSHCAKLKEKVAEMFTIIDANYDGKVTLEELDDDALDEDPRIKQIWTEIFSNVAGDTSSVAFKTSSDDDYYEGLERLIFAKSDINADNSLNVVEFYSFVGDMLDADIFFKPYDTDRNYYLDETEFSKGYDREIGGAEYVIGSTDGKLSLVEILQIVSLGDNLVQTPDFCARKSVNKKSYFG